MSDTGPSLRVDKWLWYARFFKTRSLAGKLCAEGRIRIDGTPTQKAHAAIRPGQVLTFAAGGHVRVIRVVALGTRRGPASEAQTLYEDLDPPQPAAKLPREPQSFERPRGQGRPTKRERRQLDRLRGGGPTG